MLCGLCLAVEELLEFLRARGANLTPVARARLQNRIEEARWRAEAAPRWAGPVPRR